MTTAEVAALGSQSGRAILITGANSGLGRRCSMTLAAAGAHVLMACRNAESGRRAVEDVRRHASEAEPELVLLDLADLSSVPIAAADVAARVKQLDVLMNNAGVMGLPPGRTAQGHEIHFGTNHLGHFALTGLLFDTLLRAPDPRVVTVASNGHWTGRMPWEDLHWERGRYWPWLVYSQSKLANLLFMRELDQRVRRAGLPVLSVGAHPGGANTHLAGGVKGRVRAPIYEWVASRLPSDVDGARPQLLAATAADLAGGSYYGPQELFGFRGAPGLVPMSARARDPEAARRLWELSEELTGVRFDALQAGPNRMSAVTQPTESCAS